MTDSTDATTASTDKTATTASTDKTATTTATDVTAAVDVAQDNITPTEMVAFAFAILLLSYIAVSALTLNSPDDEPTAFEKSVSWIIDIALVAAVIYGCVLLYGEFKESTQIEITDAVIARIDALYQNPNTVMVYLLLTTVVFYIAKFPLQLLNAKPALVNLIEYGLLLALIISMGVWFVKNVLKIDYLRETKVDVVAKVEKSKEKVKEVVKGNEVFNVSANIYTYPEAQAVCQAIGAELATYKQVEEAYNKGGEWCNYGWSEGQMALFPTQYSTWDKLNATDLYKHACGRPGINGGYISNPNIRFGVNCFGKKPDETDQDKARRKAAEIPTNAGPAGDLVTKAKQDFWKKNSTQFLTLNSFNRTEWSET